LRSERITFARTLAGVRRSDFACDIAANRVGTALGGRLSAIGLGEFRPQGTLPAAEEGSAVVTMNRIDNIDDPIDEPARDAMQNALHSGQMGPAMRACGQIGAATLVAEEGGLDSGKAPGMAVAAPFRSAGAIDSNRDGHQRDAGYAQLDESDCGCMCACTHNAAECVMATPERTAETYPRIRLYESRSAW
jgi:hypothetical protein